MGYPTDERYGRATIMEPLQKRAIPEKLPLDISPASTGSRPDAAWRRPQPGHLLCACCSRSYLNRSSLSLDHQPRNKGSRKYFQQFIIDTASDEELEIMLQEEMERLVDLELLVQGMQDSTDEDAATLLAKLRSGTSLDQLTGIHKRA